MTTNPEGLRELADKWEARARDAHPSDAMLINRHVRELREALAAPINPVAVDSTVIGEPVAWAIQMPDGSIGKLGWRPMDEFSPINELATLADGCRYVLAYWPTPPAAAAGRGAVIAELIEAATAAQGDGVDRVVACHGYKCRELNCASCFGEDAAAQYVDAARVRAHRLSVAINAARASTLEANDEPR